MIVLKNIFIAVLGLIFIIGLSYGFGWIGVHKTLTIGKAMQDAKTEVYENSNAFTKAKRMECIKYYKEWNESESIDDKKAIENIVSMSLSDFNEDEHIHDVKLLNWIKKVKY